MKIEIFKSIMNNNIYYCIRFNNSIFIYNKFTKSVTFIDNIFLKLNSTVVSESEIMFLKNIISEEIEKLKKEEKELNSSLEFEINNEYINEVHKIKNELIQIKENI